MNKIELSLVVLFVLCLSVMAQSPSPSPSPAAPPPVSDIYLMPLQTKGGELKLGQPNKITDWNGYNNQPFFLPDNRSLFYTSIREDKQADIFRYDVTRQVNERLTFDPESEFSPTLTPDGKFFSVIRVEADNTQRLWKFPLDKVAPVLVLKDIKPVGYQCWIDQNTVALFILGQPNTLQIVDVNTGRAEVVAQNIGRTLRLIPKQDKLSFVHKVSAQEWVIKAVDLKTRQISTVIKTLPGSEDYAWTPSGILLATREAKIYKWDPQKDSDWVQVADLSGAGLKTLTRLAVSPKSDWLAVVGAK
ncbi:MAG TPA: hypothetical protein VKB46_02975 [Pyrinomonadaceae bacterium]|nr:hypothetical protein [Pyrinomonadaceae bacterium]